MVTQAHHDAVAKLCVLNDEVCCGMMGMCHSPIAALKMPVGHAVLYRVHDCL